MEILKKILLDELNKNHSPHIGRALACLFMERIQYDNGSVDRWNPEHYEIEWIEKIGPIAENFFCLNNIPISNKSNDIIEEIATGFHKEVHARFSEYKGFAELDKVLNDYFDR